jgi:hypothetical protein
MPLFDDKGSKGDDLFCILVTQPTDRSLPGLQSYRPYEIRGSGQGKEFTNDFVLLAVRNSSLTNGTLETIQNVLNRALSSDDSYKTPPSVESSKGISTDSSLDVPEQLNTPKNGDENPTKRVQTRLRTGSGATATTEFAPDVESVGIFDRLDWIRKQQKLERMKARENDARMKRKPSDVDDDSEAQSKRLNTEEAPFTRTQQLTPASPGSAAMSPQREESTPTLDRPSTSHQRPGLIDTEKSASPSFSRHQSIVITSPAIHSRLTEEQAKRVRIIWTVFVDDDIECDFERGLDECETFSDLLNLFREDTELDPQAAAALTNTKLWRIMYQLPGHARKAFNVRVGNEVAFERFQEALAQSSIWNDSPGVRFDIQLRALN